MNDYALQTLGSIVASNFKTAAIFSKYHLDFCCGGKRTLAEACKQKNIDTASLVGEILLLNDDSSNFSFNSMGAGDLINYILLKHHFYTRQQLPLIHSHLSKVASKHGWKYTFIVDVLNIFEEFQDELMAHMTKEETVLFPAIRLLQIQSDSKANANTQKQIFEEPIRIMMQEHEIAGEMMEQIRKLTNEFTPPEDACTTFRIVLMELQDFEKNLHMHVHLENNLLFPMTEQILNSENMLQI